MVSAPFAILFFLFSTIAAQAQENWWVQIAARPTLAEATAFARDTAARVSGVQGFYLGNGFYAITIGPFDRPAAERTRQRLVGSGAVPADSFVSAGGNYDRQFWPVGGAISAPVPAPVTAAPVVTSIPDETPREARASESALTRSEREDLQRALQWAGVYNAAIDGAFGRGTRAAMEAWQIANAMEPTGVLTTRQRAALMRQYNTVLNALDLQTLRETETGIAIAMPTAAVAFTEYRPPFAKFEATGSIPNARVLLISQQGDAAQMRGLYEIMQSLDIVPVDGSRSFRPDRFVIEGTDATIASFTEVRLQNGAMKGFTLVWPADDMPTRDRLLAEMRASFTTIDGTLDPDIVPLSEDQSIDMVAGLAIRQPRLSRSGFYVATDGRVLTTHEATDGCERITLDRETEVTLQASDPDLGLVLLTPQEPRSPLAVAQFEDTVPRLRDRVAVAGFPFGGVLADPTLTFGAIADLRDLTGDDRKLRLDMATEASDAGGALLNSAGMITGMLLPPQAPSSQILPETVSFAVKAADISQFLNENGVVPQVGADRLQLSPVALTRQAAEIGVLVSCW